MNFQGRISAIFFLLLLSTFPAGKLIGQNSFAMMDTTVTECYGTLTDSEAGTPAPNYDHNEDLIFTICPTAPVGAITLTFTSFSTESCCDILRIFQGADTFGVLINSFSGGGLPPQTIVNGCVTFHFKSDQLIAGPGWIVNWDVQLSPPPPPSFAINPVAPGCSTNSVTATFNYKWYCDSVYTGTFSIAGPVSPTVTVTPIACTNDSSSNYNLAFAPGLNLNGNYTITFNGNWRDVCDSVHALTATSSFTINNCPLSVVINTTNDTICPGQCVNLIAVGNGGIPATYVYTWNNGVPNGPGFHTVCPTVTTTYTVTLDDATAAPIATDNQIITVLLKPTAQANVTVCQSDPPFNLTAAPAGGIWTGFGIISAVNGTFDPDSAGPGPKTIYYTTSNGCQDTVIITVTPHTAGPDQASCPGAASFNMTGFNPAGGTWSGPFINGAGVFNPSTIGAHVVTYTLGGCSDTKTVNVANISVQPDDTMCSSQGIQVLTFSPPGGIWSGTGIVNPLMGWFSTSLANIGVNTLTYTMNGCNATVDITVDSITAGPDLVICVKDAPFAITGGSPAGGVWTGPAGAVTAGLFDPNYASGNQVNALLTYTLASCTDQMYMYVRVVWIGYDTLMFCSEKNINYPLSWSNTNRSPNWGTWSGAGLVSTGQDGPFNPSLAGPGSHTLYYTYGNCYDSLVVIVQGNKQLTDTTVCELEPAFYLSSNPKDPVAGETWVGTGIANIFSGMFDPAVAGTGVHQIIYTSYLGCKDTTTITVTPQDSIYINGLAASYCYQDTVINLTVYPAGGIMIGPASGLTFNPSFAGQGTHLLTYTAGTGACQKSTQVYTTVGAPIEMQTTTTDDSICLGEYVTLSVSSFGGTGTANHSYAWNNGLSPSFKHLLNPQTSTQYIVTVSDGCSEPVTDTIDILVNQPFQINFDSSLIQCYGESGWLTAIPSVAGNYSFVWNTIPAQAGDTVFAKVWFDYTVRVTDLNSTCYFDATARIPGWDRIFAKFSANPSNCANMEDPVIDFLDLTLGADAGIWYFGDGDSTSFIGGMNTTHIYGGVGSYLVMLAVSNAGGCKDTHSIEVCIDPVPIHVYNTFSPNGDGYNDFFEIEGAIAYPFSFLSVFNRYGNVVYEQAAYINDWNGTNYQSGEALPDGAYFYIFDRGDGSDKVIGDVVIFR